MDKTNGADTLIAGAERAAQAYSDDPIARLSYHVGLLRSDIRLLCNEAQTSVADLIRQGGARLPDRAVIDILEALAEVCVDRPVLDHTEIASVADRLRGALDEAEEPLSGEQVQEHFAEMCADDERHEVEA